MPNDGSVANKSQSQRQSLSYVTTDGQSASLSWNKAPIWGLRPDFCYCQTITGLWMWGALSDERTGLSFTTAAGPGQSSHSRVRVPWDSRLYFIVSHLRPSFSSPPTTRRATVEVFDPASIWGLRPDLDYCLTVAGLLIWGALSNERTDLQFAIATGPRQRSYFRVRSPVGFVAIFYCLRFETSFFVASYDSQGHGGGIRSRLHTGLTREWVWVLYYDRRSVGQSVLE
jgi:hypothetical protein